jgi:DNA-binding beta-propeller fold protein YncE
MFRLTTPHSQRRAGARTAFAAALLTAFAASADAEFRPFQTARHFDQGGFVYAMTNNADANEILVYFRNRSGGLREVRVGPVGTGGAGGSVTAAVDPLGSQDSLIYDEMHDMLFAVNAGSDTVTGFDTSFLGVPFAWNRKIAPSGGNIPVSLAVLEDKLFVLNAGGTGSVATIEIGPYGRLTLIDSFDLGLAPQPTTPPFNQVMAPGQIGVDALDRQLIVTYGAGQAVLTIALDDDGLPAGPVVSTPSPGVVPFAFDVTPYGSILVAEAGSGAVSAYDPSVGGAPLNLVAATVATGQAATCWIVVHPGGYAYVTNTGSDTLSQYQYTRTGGLALVEAIVATATGAPTDMTIAGEGSFIYTLNAASGEISGFAVDPDSGALTLVETEAGLPASAGIQGIAARD